MIGTHEPAVTLAGKIEGVFNLTVDHGRHFEVNSTATNSRLKGDTYVTSPEGEMHFTFLSLQAASRYTYPEHLKLVSTEIMMRYSSEFSAESIEFNVQDIHMEGEAILNVVGRGFGAGEGTGSGGVDADNYGIGGGYGGYGGGAQHVDYATGLHYGSYKNPQDKGSGGGGEHGGSGGSTIKLEVSRYFHLDGYLSASGGDASGGNSGGGSGGSIDVDVLIFSGHGNITTEGGEGAGSGYGGAGGRIYVNCNWMREYAGHYIAYGGYSGASRTDGNGAAGTVFFTDNPRGPAFTEYDNSTGTPVKINEEDKLLIDNDNRQHDLPTMIESHDGSIFEFQEIEALNHVTLQFTGTDELIAHKFSGDKTGVMHLQTGQTMWVEYKESETTYTVAPISYTTDEGSMLVLPSEVVLLGTRTKFHGFLVGVHNLTIADSAKVNLF